MSVFSLEMRLSDFGETLPWKDKFDKEETAATEQRLLT